MTPTASSRSAFQADLLLHVLDVNSPERHDQVAEVNKVLAEIGAQAIPQIVVYNKTSICRGWKQA